MFYADSSQVNKATTFKEKYYNKIVNLLSFMLLEESRKVYDLKAYAWFFVFLYLHLYMGVSDNLIIGFM